MVRVSTKGMYVSQIPHKLELLEIAVCITNYYTATKYNPDDILFVL